MITVYRVDYTGSRSQIGEAETFTEARAIAAGDAARIAQAQLETERAAGGAAVWRAVSDPAKQTFKLAETAHGSFRRWTFGMWVESRQPGRRKVSKSALSWTAEEPAHRCDAPLSGTTPALFEGATCEREAGHDGDHATHRGEKRHEWRWTNEAKGGAE